MNANFAQSRKDITDSLKILGLTIAPDALKPLQRINFSKLVQIMDHEERFLRVVFFNSLMTAYQSRLQDEPGSVTSVTAQDVRAAMLMLGSAAEKASDDQFSGSSKSIIKDVCPYCAATNSAA